jgi:hypothetical protein
LAGVVALMEFTGEARTPHYGTEERSHLRQGAGYTEVVPAIRY